MPAVFIQNALAGIVKRILKHGPFSLIIKTIAETKLQYYDKVKYKTWTWMDRAVGLMRQTLKGGEVIKM